MSDRCSTVQIWGWRFLAWLGCWTGEILHFKARVPWNLGVLVGAEGNEDQEMRAVVAPEI